MENNRNKTGLLPLRLHHHAYVCADQERTRRFYEDVLGLPLIAFWIESATLEGKHASFSHAFYGLKDGSALAFFNFADPDLQQLYTARQQDRFVHIALAVDETTQNQIKQRLEKAGLAPRVTDHGYCSSLYVIDPDNLRLEFTCDPADVGKINEFQNATAHKALKGWMAGDRTVNNDLREHR